jgi:hypothetical protein
VCLRFMLLLLRIISVSTGWDLRAVHRKLWLVLNAHSSCSGGLGLKSRPGDWLP